LRPRWGSSFGERLRRGHGEIPDPPRARSRRRGLILFPSIISAIPVWVARLEGHEESTHDLAFSPDGAYLASCSGGLQSTKDRTIRVWDLAAGRELRRFEGHRGAVSVVAFTRDGRSVVSGSEDATALVWDIADLKDRSEPVTPLAPEALLACWNELASNEARAAYRAMRVLSVPSAVRFLRDHLRPASAADGA
jgi:WD40 repeat protein